MNPPAPAGAGRPITVATPVSPESATRPVEGLTLGPRLVLPVEAVTETFAILAKRGAGPGRGVVGAAQLRRRHRRGLAGGHLRG